VRQLPPPEERAPTHCRTSRSAMPASPAETASTLTGRSGPSGSTPRSSRCFRHPIIRAIPPHAAAPGKCGDPRLSLSARCRCPRRARRGSRRIARLGRHSLPQRHHRRQGTRPRRRLEGDRLGQKRTVRIRSEYLSAMLPRLTGLGSLDRWLGSGFVVRGT
jgi:hypothetical protein